MNFKRLNTASEITRLIEFHNANSGFVTLDCETTSKNPREAVLIDIQITGYEEDSAVIFAGEYGELLSQLHPDLILVGHSYKYDAHVLFRHGVDLLDRTWRDTMLIGHLLDENRDSYSLDSYIKEYYNDDYKEKFWAKYKSYEESDEVSRIEYACKDIVYTGKIYRRFIADLNEQGIPDSLLTHVHRLQASLLRTEISGIGVDLDYLQELGVRLKRRIDELGPQIRGVVKDEIELVELQVWHKLLEKYKTEKGKRSAKRPEFSLTSTNQLQQLLYGILELPIQRNAKTRTISTDYDSLVKIQDLHPVVPLILDYRQYPVVYDTFVCGTLNKQQNGRIYPSFRVNGTKGARISHQEPNMGNIPSSGGVKGIFLPDEGELFGEFDYAQLEVCVEAHLTQDKNLLDIVCNGASKHDITAHNLGIERSLAKTVNFAMQYFCGPNKVAKILGCSNKEGEHAWKKFWETYPGPMQLKNQTDKMINDGIPLTDMFGRKRRFAHRKRSHWDKDFRSGYNFMIQSPGGQMMNNAFYKADTELRAKGLGKGVLTVHDSGLMGLTIGKTSGAAQVVEFCMVNEGVLANLTVPLKISSKIDMPRWLDK